ncbi:hypothetical protein Tco_1115183 [Tanacetum coccineum]
MTTLQFADTHNLVTFLSKPAEIEGFEEIVDFLNANPIKYALTINHTIYTSCIEQFWATAKVKTINWEVQLQALVDGKKIIVTEASVRRDLQLNDEEDEAINEEMDDSLVRATTTATGLDAEQDSGNINKTHSKATPNEPGSTRTSLGGGPRRQETMGDTIAQTRFENVSKTSNDSLIVGVNTPRSDEDRLKLNELMEFFKKLEKKGGSRTHKLKRLYKVGRFAKVISSDEASLGDQEDASKQGRKIDDIDKDAEITLVHETHGRYCDEEMFDTGVLVGYEVLAEPEVTVKDVNLSVDEVTLAQALVQDKGKGKIVEPEKPKKKKELIRLDEEIALKLQAEFDEEVRLAREKSKKEEEANIVAWNNVQAMIDVDYQMVQQMQSIEQEELSIEEKSKLFVQLLEARKKHFAVMRSQEIRNKPPTNAQNRNTMSTYLKNKAGYKHNQLKNKSFDDIQKLFDKAMKRVNTFVDMDTELVEGSEVRAEGSEHKLEEDKETTELQRLIEVIPDTEEVAIDVIPLATKPPSIVDYKIHKEGKKTYYQIIRADGSLKMYLVFSHMLKSFDREDLETLWLAKSKHGSTRPEEGYERVL